MTNVIVDINGKPTTIYYAGSQNDDKAYSLSFTNLKDDGTEYAITLQNSEETFKLQPLKNNVFVLSNKYTKQPGLINIQVYQKKEGDWVAFSKVLKIMLTPSIQSEAPEPEPTDETVYVVYKEYNDNGYDLTGLGPCIVQNEKTDVNIKIGTNEHTEIDCLGGQYTLIKKVDGSDGIIGYYTDDDGRCNYLEVTDGTIVNGFADGENHWGLLSVSADSKTLTKLDYVNGLSTDVTPSDEKDVTNKKYVDDTNNTNLNSAKNYTDEKISQIVIPSGGLSIKQIWNNQELHLETADAGVYIVRYYNQDVKIYIIDGSKDGYYILGGLIYLYKKLSESENGEYIGYFLGSTSDQKQGLSLFILKNNNNELNVEMSPTGPISDFV